LVLLVVVPLQEGVDSKDLGVTKARSTPADWAAQGRKLLDQGIFEAAAKCYERAGDVARAQASGWHCAPLHQLGVADWLGRS
jgi:hypothetical protein